MMAYCMVNFDALPWLFFKCFLDSPNFVDIEVLGRSCYVLFKT